MGPKLTYDELYAALIKASTMRLPDHYFTAKQHAEDIKKPRSTVAHQLAERAKRGELETCIVNINGTNTRIYWFPNEDEDPPEPHTTYTK